MGTIEDLKSLNLPSVFEEILHSNAPKVIGRSFESPANMAAVIKQHPDEFSDFFQLTNLDDLVALKQSSVDWEDQIIAYMAERALPR